jgi:two-component system, OmpR family, sensor histidine kinase TctE
MRRVHSLRGRLIASMLFVFTLGLGASATFYYFEVHWMGNNLHERTMQGQAREFLAGLNLGKDGTIELYLPPVWIQAYAREGADFSYTLYDVARHPVAMSPNLARPLPLVEIPSSDRYGKLEFTGIDPGQQAALAARAPAGHVLVVARKNLSHDEIGESLLEEDYENLFVLVPFILVSLILIWIVSGWSLRPLARASRQAASVGPANSSVRISADGLPREIRPLVGAVNGALDRLADAYAAERRFTADAAHELRTPLAVLNLRLQRAKLSGAMEWPAIEWDLGQMNRLVNQLMDLARKEAAGRRHADAEFSTINLARVVREAAAMVVPLAEESGRQLEVDVPDVMPCRGRPDDLRDMVRNLLDNALIHGRGTVRVRLRPETDGPARGVVIEVSDEGPGVPRGMEETVFDRFRKLSADAPGSGLGLAIVRQVARSHGGDVRFARNAGRVEILLPFGDPSRPATPSPSEASQKIAKEG